MNAFNVYDKINALIVEKLEQGEIPWNEPWNSPGNFPRNLISKRFYRGFNFFYLWSLKHATPYYLTWNQVQKLDGKVKRGSKSYPVIFWKLLEGIDKDGLPTKVPYLRYYNVFNVADVEGIEKYIPTPAPVHNFTPIEACERLLSNWVTCPPIEHGYDGAAFNITKDIVQMPNHELFISDEEYYHVLFHELIHSTGHSSRTNRFAELSNHSFASQDYSIEELVAELGASYLCGLTGIHMPVIDNSSVYISNWLKHLKNDNKFFIKACSLAQRACDYILFNLMNEFLSIDMFEDELANVDF
jgi:antirestriction protein ArdC